MSRRRGEKQSLVVLFECVALFLLSLKLANADGNVGCLYLNSLCDPNSEWCYDDSAFGRCIYKYGFTPDSLFKYKFKYDDLENLKEILQQLRELDFTWKHLYTQCIVQTQLYAIRTGIQYDADVCDQLLKQEIADPIRLLRYEQTRSRNRVGVGVGTELFSHACVPTPT